MRFRLVVDGDPHEVDATSGPRHVSVRVDGVPYRAEARTVDDAVIVRIGGRSLRVRLAGDLAVVGRSSHRIAIPEVVDLDERPSRRPTAGTRRTIEVRLPMPGRIARVLAQPGLHVKKGQVLVVLEAMKMQNEIPAPVDGLVKEIRVAEGDSVSGNRVVAVLVAR